MREEVGVHLAKQIRRTHEIGHLARDQVADVKKTKRAEAKRDADRPGIFAARVRRPFEIRTGGVPLARASER